MHKGDTTSPYEQITGKRPTLTRLRVFGCQVFVKDTEGRTAKLRNDVHTGIFLGYTKTTKNIYYLDDVTKVIKIASHVRFDEMMVRRNNSSPNAEALHAAVHQLPFDDSPIAAPDIVIRKTPFRHSKKYVIEVKCNHPTFGIEPQLCSVHNRIFVSSILPNSSFLTIKRAKHLKGSYILSVGGCPVHNVLDFEKACESSRFNSRTNLVEIILAHEQYVNVKLTHERMPLMHHDQLHAVMRVILEAGEGTHETDHRTIHQMEKVRPAFSDGNKDKLQTKEE